MSPADYNKWDGGQARWTATNVTTYPDFNNPALNVAVSIRVQHLTCLHPASRCPAGKQVRHHTRSQLDTACCPAAGAEAARLACHSGVGSRCAGGALVRPPDREHGRLHHTGRPGGRPLCPLCGRFRARRQARPGDWTAGVRPHAAADQVRGDPAVACSARCSGGAATALHVFS